MDVWHFLKVLLQILFPLLPASAHVTPSPAQGSVPGSERWPGPTEEHTACAAPLSWGYRLRGGGQGRKSQVTLVRAVTEPCLPRWSGSQL